SAGYTWSHFASQHLVDLSGSLVPEVRNDVNQTLSLQGTWPVLQRSRLRLFGSLGYSWNHLYSEQNHYDAQKVFFNSDYYANIQQMIQNQWTLAVGDNPWTLSWNWSITHQKYADRLVQDGTGTYGTDITHVDSFYTGLTFSYPIAKGFRLLAMSQMGWNDSNNTDNQVYQYHYNSQTYLLGFSYAY